MTCNIYIYIYITLIHRAWAVDWELKKDLFGGMWSRFGVQVGGLGDLKGTSQAPNPAAQAWRTGSSLLNGFLKGLGRDLEGFGLAQGRLGARIRGQHGPNLRQLGANLGPT